MTTKIKISSDIYSAYELQDHIYAIPDTYIGSVARSERVEWAMRFEDEEGRKAPFAIPQRIDTPSGMERLFIEPLSNTGDNVPRSRKAGIDPGDVEVNMDDHAIVIKSGGYPIPIDTHSSGKLAPELIFGQLLTGSNYKGDREGAGRNGYGAKLTNIFSKEFRVLVGDNGNGRTFEKRWYNNMKNSDPAVVQEGYNGPNYVIVAFILDFARFRMEKYGPQEYALFARLCADLANSWRIPVTFNGYRFEFKTPKLYAPIYFATDIEKAIHFNLYPEGTALVKKGRSFVPEDSKIAPIADIYLMDTPFENHHISFINGMMTRDGGIHVECLLKTLSAMILGRLKEDYYASSTKKGGKNEKKKGERFPLDLNDIRHNISFIANFYLPNPTFNSQSKTHMTGWSKRVEDDPVTVVPIKINEELLDPLDKWKLMDRLYVILEQKQESKMSKTDGKRKRFQRIEGYDAANDACSPKSHECILMITEGKSAAAYGKVVRDAIPNNRGNDILGILSVRGKLLNVMNAKVKEIIESKVIERIKQTLGLKEGTDYRGEDFHKLSYGRVIIATDADVDGYHIRGLLYNYFFVRFPSLFYRPGFFLDYRIPIVRIEHNSTIHRFYTLQQFETFLRHPGIQEYLRRHPDATKYFKGLGSSEDSEIIEDWNDPHKLVIMLMDQDGPQNICLAFNDKLADQRKIWITAHEPKSVEMANERTMSHFIHNDLIQFSIADISRSIPRLSDSLKNAGRKALRASQMKWGVRWQKKIARTRTGQFAYFVAGEMVYHHGEQAMVQTVLLMMQKFVGANNLPYFKGDGQTGTRAEGGKDAASVRYIFMAPNWCLPYIFREEDEPLLKIIIEEGTEIEPETYYPILPMVLVNGTLGIATGWSTFIPCHNPLTVCKWIKAKLRNEKLPKVYPWYRDFRGVLQLVDRANKKKITIHNGEDSVVDVSTVFEPEPEPEPISEKEEEESDEPEENKPPIEAQALNYDSVKADPKYSLITKGIFEPYKGDEILVKELPIGSWTLKYKYWLEELAREKKIRDMRQQGTKDFPQFLIKGFEGANDKSLHLIRSFGMTNMVLLDNNNKPRRYNTVDEILEDFYAFRYSIYIKRKEYQLGELEKQIKANDEKIRFYRAVAIDKTLIVTNRGVNDIYADMDRLNIGRSHFEKAKVKNLSVEGLRAVEAKAKKIIDAYEYLKNRSVEMIWLSEIEEFEAAYLKEYKSK